MTDADRAFIRQCYPDYFRIAVDAARRGADHVPARLMPAPDVSLNVALDRGLVDVVALLLDGVTSRDLDAIADDIVCMVLQFDDLVKVVRERLEAQQAYREAGYAAPAAEPRVAAEAIIKALHAVVRPRLSKGREL